MKLIRRKLYTYYTVFILVLVGLSLGFQRTGIAAETSEDFTNTEKYYQQMLAHYPALLIEFLRSFPKGGDLHNHLVGAIYTENFIDWGISDGWCIDEINLNIIISNESQQFCSSDGLIKLSDFIAKDAQYESLIDTLSMRNFIPNHSLNNHSGHDHFFSTFYKFPTPENVYLGRALAEVMSRAQQQHILYLELMIGAQTDAADELITGWEDPLTDSSLSELYSYITTKKRNELDQLIKQSIHSLNMAEQQAAELLSCDNDAFVQCAPTVRYMTSPIRILPPEVVFAQFIFGYELALKDSRVVGINLVAPEDHPVALRDYDLHMAMIQFLNKVYDNDIQQQAERPVNISLHAGELTLGLVPPEYLNTHINDAIHIAQAQRIGHGVDILYENDALELLKYMSQKRRPVEINLSSNELILGIIGQQHPLLAYLQYQVPLTLSTDDEGVSRINLTYEYFKAATEYQLSYEQLKMFSRNALEYSFLQGFSLWTSNETGTTPTHFTVQLKACQGKGLFSAQCEMLLKPSEKARIQRDLELAFLEFEKKYSQIMIEKERQ